MTLKTGPETDRPPVTTRDVSADRVDDKRGPGGDVAKKAGERSDAEVKAGKQRAEAEAKLVEVQRRAERTPVGTWSGELRPAAESSDPTVHRLLAERQGIVSSADLELDPEAEEVRKLQRDVARAQVAEIDALLATYGYTAK